MARRKRRRLGSSAAVATAAIVTSAKAAELCAELFAQPTADAALASLCSTSVAGSAPRQQRLSSLATLAGLQSAWIMCDQDIALNVSVLCAAGSCFASAPPADR